MGKVLLIFPPSNYIKERIFPPLGLAYIASMLEKFDIPVKIIDATALNFSLDQTVKIVKKEKPSIVGIQTSLFTFKECKLLTFMIKKLLPDVFVVLGGTFPTALPRKTLEETMADACVIGEGEYIMLELVKAIERGWNLRKVRGLAVKKGRKIYLTGSRELTKNLDSLPFPARHLLPDKKYKFLPHEFKKEKPITILASRGCPFNCTFCSKPVFGNTYRIRSPENIILEMREAIENYGIRSFYFIDDVFGLYKNWTKKFCDKILEENLNVKWSCETRVDLLDKELLVKMAKAGCWSIFLGVETFSPRLMKILNKEFKITQIKKIFKLARRFGISLRASFMLGLPTESKRETIHTIKFAKKLNPSFAQFHLFSPFENTKIFDVCKNEGKIFKESGDYDSLEKINFLPHAYTCPEELILMQKYAYKNFYFDPKKIIEILSSFNLNRLRALIDTNKLLCKTL
jgi:radical SAM superfamily enzyme YgiQ (UPF0313 family)